MLWKYLEIIENFVYAALLINKIFLVIVICAVLIVHIDLKYLTIKKLHKIGSNCPFLILFYYYHPWKKYDIEKIVR